MGNQLKLARPATLRHALAQQKEITHVLEQMANKAVTDNDLFRKIITRLHFLDERVSKLERLMKPRRAKKKTRTRRRR